MTTQIETIRAVQKEGKKAGIHLKFAQTHPVLAYLLLAFGLSWLILLSLIPWKDQNPLLVMAVSLVGGYGIPLGGILALGLKNGMTIDLNRGRLALMFPASLVIFGLMALEYQVGKTLGYGSVSQDAVLSIPILFAAVAASLTGGWVVSSPRSSQVDIRERMASLLPTRAKAGWVIFSLLFYPVMALLSWGISLLIGAEVEYPALWGRPALEVLPLALLTFSLTALARGGMEEPGWRGVLQPELQKRFSPLVAALLVSFVWSLWHLPFYLNGFYSDPLVIGMIGGAIFRVFLAIFLAWAYNRSGSLLTVVILHTSFNMVLNFLPTSDLVILVLWLIVTVMVVVKDKMYRRIHR